MRMRIRKLYDNTSCLIDNTVMNIAKSILLRDKYIQSHARGKAS